VWIGTATAELVLPGPRSLKDKRRIVRSVVERWRRLGLAAAEVGDHEDWHSAVIGAAACSGSRTVVEAALEQARRIVDEHPDVGSVAWHSEVGPWPA
jgi:uncharacterized protein